MQLTVADDKRALQPTRLPALDYLVIGHVTADLTSLGVRLGGTAAFSGLTAQALGLKTGIITACSPELDISLVNPLIKYIKNSSKSTTFENISNGVHRVQHLYHRAEPLTKDDIPQFDPDPDIVHLGPVANEVDWEILSRFPHSLKCLTPQGWMRGTDPDQKVVYQHWEGFENILPQADVAVISHEDVRMEESLIEEMASAIPVFVVTENFRGARVYWHNDVRFIKAPEVKYEDDTGAGDIFATAFFYRYLFTKDPWEAGRFAVTLASCSVTRQHLNSIPTADEILQAKMQLIG
jgi:sugar/nucleoside kinase (ribokinase family)